MEEDVERVVDPFVARPPKFRLPKASFYTIIGNFFLSIILVVICQLVDTLIGTEYRLADLGMQILSPTYDPTAGKSLFMAYTLALSLMFGVVLTIIGLVLEMAASKFTGSVSSLFFRDPIVMAMIGSLLIINVTMFLVFQSSGPEDRYVPRASINLITLAVVVLLLAVPVFMHYAFFFLDPQKVVTRVVMSGLNGVVQAVNDRNGENVEEHQYKAIASIEQLRDAAARALKKKDKNIAAKSVDALCSFALHYGRRGKRYMFSHWFDLPDWIKMSPDFILLSPEAVRAMEDAKTWLEFKIFRQYQELLNEGIWEMKEICWHIAINTKLIAQAAAFERGDFHTLELAMRFFNTYLRAAINKDHVHTMYIILYQYRQLAESLIVEGKLLRDTKDPTNEEIGALMEEKALTIAKYMRWYGSEILRKPKMVFIIEVISHDIRFMCETAALRESSLHDKLLEVFLTIYDGKSGEGGETAILGFRRAQLCLATAYLVMGKEEHARKIFDDFIDEKHERLIQVYYELLGSTREFWEVSERETNLQYITPEQKRALPVLWGWFPGNTEGKDNITQLMKKEENKKQMKKVQDVEVTEL